MTFAPSLKAQQTGYIAERVGVHSSPLAAATYVESPSEDEQSSGSDEGSSPVKTHQAC